MLVARGAVETRGWAAWSGGGGATGCRRGRGTCAPTGGGIVPIERGPMDSQMDAEMDVSCVAPGAWTASAVPATTATGSATWMGSGAPLSDDPPSSAADGAFPLVCASTVTAGGAEGDASSIRGLMAAPLADSTLAALVRAALLFAALLLAAPPLAPALRAVVVVRRRGVAGGGAAASFAFTLLDAVRTRVGAGGHAGVADKQRARGAEPIVRAGGRRTAAPVAVHCRYAMPSWGRLLSAWPRASWRVVPRERGIMRIPHRSGQARSPRHSSRR